ncbi:MAG: TetR/AcrR family transcriptional regulator [Iphinoe sp. HA4291-MV1]|nr:TetR/AcrR family transcriptional regulator [Iphinoe sp. HA4291-MV1]
MSREEVIAQLTKMFRQYGYEGTTLARLSEATGLGKASLYHHFPKGKEEMAQAVLESMSDRVEASILASLRGCGEPLERIRVMTTNVDKLYSSGKQSCLLAVLALSEAKDLFHNEIQNALNLWINTLAQVLVEAGIEHSQAQQRAEDAILKIQGSLILARSLDNTAPFKRVLDRLPEELLQIERKQSK